MAAGIPIGHVGDGYGIFIDWLGAKKALEDRQTFPRHLQKLYDIFYVYVRLHPLAVGARAITFGDSLYAEALSTAPALSEPIGWTQSLAIQMQNAGFPAVAYVTTGEIFGRIVDSGQLKVAQHYGSTILDGVEAWGAGAHTEVTGVSMPLVIATKANEVGAKQRWGTGIFVHQPVCAALRRPASGQMFQVDGEIFYRL
jgi:hypothetical protein